MKQGRQAGRKFPRGYYRRTEKETAEEPLACEPVLLGCFALLAHLPLIPHLEQASLSWAEPHSHSCFITPGPMEAGPALSPNPHG